MNVLGLVQLCQSSQEAGGYGYSFGIERLAVQGKIASAEDLAELVKGVLSATIGPADGVASGIAFRAARKGNFETLPAVCLKMSSLCLPAEMHLASLQMGQRLWGVSRKWDWAGAIHQQLDDMAMRTDLHHAVAFGALVSETTSSEVRAIASYLFNIACGIVATAVRAARNLPPPAIDEAAAQRALSEVQPALAQLAAACADRHAGDIISPGAPDHDSFLGHFP